MEDEPFGMVAGGATVCLVVIAFIGFGWVVAAVAALAVVAGLIWLIVYLVRKAVSAHQERQALEDHTWNTFQEINNIKREARMEINDLVGESWRNEFE